MAGEITGQEEPASITEQPAQVTASEIGKFIGPAGELLEGWKDGLLPEDLRHEKVYDLFTDIKGAFKTIGGQARLVGKKGVLVPTEISTPSDWDVFYKAIGRPDNAKDYKVEKPKELPDEYWDENVAGSAKELFHKIGLTPKQAEAILAFDNQRMLTGIKQLTGEDEAEIEEAERIIREEAGDAYDSRLHLANRMIAENIGKYNEERKAKLLEAINEPSVKPYIMDFLANIAKKFIEHKIITEIEPTAGLTIAEADTKMKELIATPGYATGQLKYTNPAAYERMVKEVAELAKIATPKS